MPYPFIVLPSAGTAPYWRNFRSRQGAVAYARVAANRRRVAFVIWRRTPAGVKLVRRQEPERTPSPDTEDRTVPTLTPAQERALALLTKADRILHDACRADVLTVLTTAPYRLTAPRVLAELGRRGLAHEPALVRKVLTALVAEGALDNDRTARPPGYRLVVKGG